MKKIISFVSFLFCISLLGLLVSSVSASAFETTPVRGQNLSRSIQETAIVGSVSVTGEINNPVPTCIPRPACVDSNPQCTMVLDSRYCGVLSESISISGVPPVAVIGACLPRPKCLDTNPRCLMKEPSEGWCPLVTITVKPCMERPKCLDTNPRCLMKEPSEGWCPPVTITVKPSPTPTCIPTCSGNACQQIMPGPGYCGYIIDPPAVTGVPITINPLPSPFFTPPFFSRPPVLPGKGKGTVNLRAFVAGCPVCNVNIDNRTPWAGTFQICRTGNNSKLYDLFNLGKYTGGCMGITTGKDGSGQLSLQSGSYRIYPPYHCPAGENCLTGESSPGVNIYDPFIWQINPTEFDLRPGRTILVEAVAHNTMLNCTANVCP